MKEQLTSAPQLELRGLSKTYTSKKTQKKALAGVSFVLGPEGSQMIYGDTVIDLQDHTIHEEALAAVIALFNAGFDED